MDYLGNDSSKFDYKAFKDMEDNMSGRENMPDDGQELSHEYSKEYIIAIG